MPRQARYAPGDAIYHVLNRAAGGMELFRHDMDYAAFTRVLAHTLEQIPMRVCGWCLMPTHWHLVLWPRREGEMSRFMQRLTITHVRRWVEYRRRVGMGSVYQGRYKSFPVQDDEHFSTLMRYVHRNPLNAQLVRRAENWKWSSLRPQTATDVPNIEICRWPIVRRADWLDWVNRPQTPLEEQRIKRSMTHSRPLGTDSWTARMEKSMSLPPLRPRGRPTKEGKINA